jgi:hypothetical protein
MAAVASPAAPPSAAPVTPPVGRPTVPAAAPSEPLAAPPVGAATPAPRPAASPVQLPTAPAAVAPAAPVQTPAPVAPTPSAPPVETDVLPAREEPPAKEEGTSAITDVVLGENIPDLVKGRRPVWPPLARLGNVAGDVVVRFTVDLAGRVTVHSGEGPDLLKPAAEQAVATWTFRRTAIDRLNLIATFKFGSDRAVARIERAPQTP